MKFHSIEDLKNEKYSLFELIKDTIQLLKPYKWRFIAASFIRLLGDLANLYPAFAPGSLVNFQINSSSGESLGNLWQLVGFWFLASLVRSLSQYFCKYLGFSVGAQVAVDSNLKTLKHMFLLDMAWHEREKSGNKLKNIQNRGGGVGANILQCFILF